ncbi:MFS general substrate transporter-65 [Coleophoma cylindrospora]|uniref:MFS general substrate transporter-65 n=1 Tax=Coleophoma cylindrospora TaxID=1849047 RepID=A0A3D8S7X3_9HELO|nr:MFS general substrate transporter-65 [Coleophoma cylindrospora]
MRASHDTDRTHVASPQESYEHMDTLVEKKTNMSNQPSHPAENAQPIPNRRFDSEIDVTGSTATNSTIDDRDVEKGDDVENEPDPEEGTPEEQQRDPNLVEWDGPNDPGNPMNWSVGKKWIVTIALGFLTFVITFASSVFSTSTIAVAVRFGVSTEVSTLGTSLFVLGFAAGPLIWGPASEVFGRKKPLFLGYFLFAIFQIPVAVAVNLETIMLCRFFGGLFGSAPLAIVGGTLADFWGPVDRGVAVCVFAAATFIGPIAGPIMGGFIVDSYLGWRWTAWITLIMASFFGTIAFILAPETAHPTLLQQRAKKMRFEQKNWAIHAKADETEVDFKNMLHNYFLKPFMMLFREPILVLVTLYMALIYGILYLFFEAYPISFQEQRGWNEGVGALPFIGLLIGVLFACATITYVTKTRFARKLKKHGRVVPEERLPPMILGAVLLPIGLFWFAWTSNPHISWVPQVLAGIPIGWGILMIFLQGLNYIIDVYMWHANSAIAANTLVRSFAGAGFPLFATAMYHTLGVPWATSLLGFLCVALIPVPILFFVYGKKIRAASKFAPSI